MQQIQPVVVRGSLVAGVPCGVARDEDSGRAYSTKRGPFHEVFNLSENERPLPGREKTDFIRACAGRLCRLFMLLILCQNVDFKQYIYNMIFMVDSSEC